MESNWSVYQRAQGAECSIITTSVDDMLIASSTTVESDAVVSTLSLQFEITDNGEPNLHLGCSIKRDHTKKLIWLNQQSYTESILQGFGYSACNSITTPMDPGARLSPATPDDILKGKDFPYTTVVRKCMYLATCTQPDIAYTI